MSRTPQDSPYRDDPSLNAVAPRSSSSSRPARKSAQRKSAQPRKQDHQRKPPQPDARNASRRPAASHANGPNGARESHEHGRRAANGISPRHAAAPHAAASGINRNATSTATAASPGGRRRSRRRGRGRGAGAAPIQLTSHPTGRAAYADTRAWLLKEHGPICAYCAREFTPEVMTLDHVAPRRGQTAYDRRDNLVLACRGCNEAKRDLSPLAYLLAVRSRAANLLRYGAHLSSGLLDLARSLLPKDHPAHQHAHHAHHHAHAHGSNGNGNGAHATGGAGGAAAAKRPAREIFGISDDDDESPYRD